MNSWKVTVIGVAATALVTALIVVGWTGGLRSAREQNIARPAPARVAWRSGRPAARMSRGRTSATTDDAIDALSVNFL